MAEDDPKEEPWEHDLEDPEPFHHADSASGHGRKRGAHALYGIMAEFDNPSDLVAAARRTHEAGYRRVNGYSPYPIEELTEAIGFTRTTLPLIVLVAAFAAVLGMLVLNKLPQPYHPVFNAPNFALATRDKFFLVIEANDPKFQHDATTQFMNTLGAMGVNDVEV